MAIQKRGDSYRVYVYKGRNEKTGKKEYHYETVKGWQKARDRHTELQNQKRNGTLAKPGKQTVGEFLDAWLKDYVFTNLTLKVYDGYKSIIDKHINPELGSIKLSALVPPRIAEYYTSRLDAGLKAQTVVHHHTLLHKAFQVAIEWGKLVRNPADGVTPPKVTKAEMQTYNTAEVDKFLEAAKDTEYYTMFVISLHAGIRRSELLALRWSDVDELFFTIRINRKLYVGKGHNITYGPPKTAKSRRLIPLTPTASLVLKEHYNNSKAMAKKLEMKFDNNFLVFGRLDTQEPYLPNTVTHAWNRIARDNKLRHIRLHDARHTMATIMFEQGIHPKIVQERLGHSTISTTLDIYSHVTPSMQIEAAKSLDAALKNTYNKADEETTECQDTTKE